MTKVETEIYTKLKDAQKVCFGPIISELGWEISYIAGFIKKYKKDNPTKFVSVATRKNRKELYDGSDLDDIFTFDIEGDYDKFTPRTHSVFEVNDKNINCPSQLDVESKFKFIKNEIAKNHNGITFYSFTGLSHNSNPQFSIKEFDNNFKTHPENSEVIKSILEKNPDKTVVTIFSRQRVDLLHRNLGLEKWQQLLEMLSRLDSYVFLIAGVSPAYVKPNPEYKNMYTLEDMCGYSENVTVLGLMIEAVRASLFTFGPETAGIHLSMVLQVPTLYFGTNYQQMSINYNPHKSQSDFIQVKVKHPSGEYDIKPEDLYKRIVEMKVSDPNAARPPEGPRTVDVAYTIPEFHPALEGLTDSQKIRKIRELNSNPSRMNLNIQPEPIDTIIKHVN